MPDPRDQTLESYTTYARTIGVDDRAVRRLYSALLVRGVHEPEIWGNFFQIPKKLSAEVGILPRLRLDAIQKSLVDGFQKLRLLTSDNLAIETVLIPLEREGRATLCLSSQVGCAMGCVFCATARMTTRRNLATWEMIDQWMHARELANSQGRRISGVVFMGMGEPFLNYDRVITAAELLRSSCGGQISAKGITISTVGIVPEIDRYTREGHKYRLSISLGAAIDWLETLDRRAVADHEHAVYERVRSGLDGANWLTEIGRAPGKGAIFSFAVEGAHAHDIAQILDRYGVAVRAGTHCAEPLMKRFGVTSSARASFALYNTPDEADAFVDALNRTRTFFA